MKSNNRLFPFWHIFNCCVCECVCTTFWLTTFSVRIFFNLQRTHCIIYMSIHIFHVRPNYNHRFFVFIQQNKMERRINRDRLAESAIEFQILFFHSAINIWHVPLSVSMGMDLFLWKKLCYVTTYRLAKYNYIRNPFFLQFFVSTEYDYGDDDDEYPPYVSWRIWFCYFYLFLFSYSFSFISASI